MKLPGADRAEVAPDKVTGYLLATGHPLGRFKAAGFGVAGYVADNWKRFAAALKQHPIENPVAKVEPSRFGTRYIVDGIIKAGDGHRPFVRTVWFIATGARSAKLITAYLPNGAS